ncbi:E3 ubiquitin-protein ligase CHIP [Escovopsis weberi]|uniref:E3 ubiquitin-protein ligase CHIP n=1 Tax=Escovopsis weberi TaxID=150374 RepID=A0A0M8N1F9_ESCWE|nr:E3 ubiquitin-protein ligase CHIP [Escovopsis weberi]
MSRATALKEEGNRHFSAGDYASAEALYSKAILADPENPALYTNRAMARHKLGLWDLVISDCQACLALGPSNMKAHFYLANAQLAIGDLDAALASALEAHRLCALTNDKSLRQATALVGQCRKDRWELRERRRSREHAELEAEVLALLARETQAALDAVAAHGGGELEHTVVREEGEAKMHAMRDVFERARAQADRRREVPSWAVDDITFGIMVDPVITKNGKSYERAAIIEHLRRHPSDPLTREPLQISDLRPNLGLRQACDEFLEENGWAVDW